MAVPIPPPPIFIGPGAYLGSNTGSKSGRGSSDTLLSKTAARRQQALAELQPHPPLNVQFQLTIAATGVPQNFPAWQVDPGQSVALYGLKAGGASNSEPAFIADYPQALPGGMGLLLSPGGSQGPQIDNLSQLWFMGTAGDGVFVVISGPSVG